jgi:cell wall-associated NlpC family hydrolase
MKGGEFLQISSSARMWFGSVALAGVLLVSSLPAFASTQTRTTPYSAKSLSVASAIVPRETYTAAIHQQLHWSSVSENLETNSSSKKIVKDQIGSVTVAKTVSAKHNSSAKNTSVVQVAEIPQQQVSRSESSEIVEHAISLQGIPYRFGGTSRKGFDCSGYSQYVFRGSGIYLPRTAAEQFDVGSAVSKRQLQSGDLVFFSTYGPGATHVGIYIGGGRFISASNDGVSISSMVSGYYATRYIGARRVR